MYNRILVATDASELSDLAVKSAIDLALSMQAELVVVRVVRRDPNSYFEGSVVLPQVDVAGLIEQINAEAQRTVDQVKAAADAKGVKKTLALVVQSETVSDAIIETARDQQCDVIVMASNGRKGLKRMLMGSETLQVLTHSHIPVLVLR
ncbi:universal stress protein [Variovorax sp. Sphag1AA]|uniref:universal stress protein n=1 Tax=Variovorax sp. Sphag1AA TaxID=2587027 RepID=UPI00161BF721|nr:universal stress protein [Variovorax sp. Sphag1AA]